jgi:hypothetical protein
MRRRAGFAICTLIAVLAGGPAPLLVEAQPATRVKRQGKVPRRLAAGHPYFSPYEDLRIKGR